MRPAPNFSRLYPRIETTGFKPVVDQLIKGGIAKMKYTHIVFDIDGTLIDTEKAVLLSLQEALYQVQSKKYNLEDLRFALGIPDDDSMKQLKVEDADLCERLWEELKLKYTHTIKIFDGMSSTLYKLKSGGTSLGIITSRTREEFTNGFVPFGIAELFDIVICADNTDKHKPNPEPMLKYLELSKADKNVTLYIGDTVYDFNCAHSAGVDFALALWGGEASKSFNPTFLLDRPQSILNILNEDNYCRKCGQKVPLC
jgi:phosphoglycolate phosphatase-like HAD superfamily hydrolase